MNYIAGSDRTEALLLPEVLDDYIAPENPVRFIDAFVGQLDLGKAGFTNAQLQETGRPPYVCPLKAKCTRNKENRTITRLAAEEVQERMAERLAANPQIMRRRKAIIEHCFGTIKRSLGYDYFLCRGMRHVTTEVTLTVLAYNLKRACNLIGVKNLIAAVS